MADLIEIVQRIVAFRQERGWQDGHTPENLAKSICIEAAELLELFQWHTLTAHEIQRNPLIQERVAEELADVMIYAMSLADQVHIDPGEAILRKLEKNAVKYPARQEPALAVSDDKRDTKRRNGSSSEV
jgi:NTP pyrophosphatase (non-canonical NTP hydrolase)